MPKSKKRKRQHAPGHKGPVESSPNWGGGDTKSSSQTKWFFIIVGAVVILGGGGYIWQTAKADRAFQDLAESGQAALAQVERQADLGRRHLNHGESYLYTDAYPTTGPHAPIPTQPGFYTAPRLAVNLVHAMEHGNVVVYYDPAQADSGQTLKQWTELYAGAWDGLVVVPRAGLNKQLVLAAWRRRLRLETFDQASAAAFIDAYRGRGPERKVR